MNGELLRWPSPVRSSIKSNRGDTCQGEIQEGVSPCQLRAESSPTCWESQQNASGPCMDLLLNGEVIKTLAVFHGYQSQKELQGLRGQQHIFKLLEPVWSRLKGTARMKALRKVTFYERCCALHLESLTTWSMQERQSGTCSICVLAQYMMLLTYPPAITTSEISCFSSAALH